MSDTHNMIHSQQVDNAIQVGVLHGNVVLRGPAQTTIPRQLPMAPRWHVARERQLDELTTRVADARPLIVIEGIGGVGKTTLALHWAHRNATQFPDGQLFANLQGFHPQAAPASPGTVLRNFLVALGVDPTSIPADVDASSALYRSVLANRRMLVLLDNARDADQVLPLLPGTTSCPVLVTTRNRLLWLRTQGAVFLRLETMVDTDARSLFDHLLAGDAIRADPSAVTAIVHRCGGLPLALTIAAARVAEHPDFPVSELVTELDEEATRLSAFDAGEKSRSLRAVLSWSSGSLDQELIRSFRLLSAAPLIEFGVPAASWLWAVSPRDAVTRLRALETVNLVRQHQPGRFQMHDLVRLHASELAVENESRVALRRLIDCFAHTTRVADILLYPHRYACAPPDLAADCYAVELVDDPSAVAWFDKEHPSLVVLLQLARREKWHDAVWHIAHGLDTYQYRLGRLAENVISAGLGLEAADALGTARLRASALRQLGRAHTRSGEFTKAELCLTEALRIEELEGFTMGQAHAHHDLQRIYSLLGRHEDALRHCMSALQLYQAENNPVGSAHSLNAQGWQRAQLGDLALARLCCEQALSLHSAHGNVSGQASTSDALGRIARDAGDLERAVFHCTAAVRYAQQLGNRFAEADHAEQLAVVLMDKGEHDTAKKLLHSAHELFSAQYRVSDAERVLSRLGAATES